MNSGRQVNSAFAFAPASSFVLQKHRNVGKRCGLIRAHPRMSLTNDIPSVLRSILDRKAVEVAALKESLAENEELTAALAKRGSYAQDHAFRDAVNLPNGTLAVIAEIKRRSPSKGHIADLRDPTQLARVYHDGGANAISVLTDLEGFGGTLNDLRAVVAAEKRFAGEFPGPCPVLRKDFIIDEIQLAEAAAAGADAVLLIISALGKERTGELLAAAGEFGLDALVEVHDEAELDAALEIGAQIIGVNNRNLNNFEEKLDTSLRLADKIPNGIVSVAESGITECVEAWKFRDAGFNAILVGEALVRAFEDSKTTSTGYSLGYNQAKGLIKAFKAKGSALFGKTSNAAFYGRGEGAKETLGEISI